MTKFEDFAENYIFKYLDRFNDKLDVWGDKINGKIDKLIEGLGVIDNSTMTDEQKEEYVFPESCMDDVEIVSNNSNYILEF